MANNGKSKAKAPVAQALARRQLDQPVKAAEMTIGEAAEIKERNRLLEAQQALLKLKQDEVNDVAKVVTLLRMESQRFISDLCRAKGLDLNDDYNVVSETGVIWRTAVAVPQEPEEVMPVEAVAAEG